MTQPQLTARAVALAALGDRAGNVTAHLNRVIAEQSLGPADAGLARELALGVVRRRRTLDAVVRAFQSGSAHRTPPRVRDVLRLGIYQVLFLDRVPDFAAVNETVSLAGGRKGLRGFVNGLLRNVIRSAGPAEAGAPPTAGGPCARPG